MEEGHGGKWIEGGERRDWEELKEYRCGHQNREENEEI